jgi:uncharacterized protein (DUF1330 family)
MLGAATPVAPRLNISNWDRLGNPAIRRAAVSGRQQVGHAPRTWSSAIQVLHAQAKPPSYVVAMINVKDEEGYQTNFLKEAQKQIAEHGGKYIAGGFNKTTALTGTAPNRVVILQFENIDEVKAWRDNGA